MLTDEQFDTFVRGYRTLCAIADHAENVHGARCVALALGAWFAELLAFLRDAGTFDDEQVERFIEIVTPDGDDLQEAIESLLASANDLPVN